MEDSNNDFASPFFLHPGENPTLVLVLAPFSEGNYHSWGKTMEIMLISNCKMQILDSSMLVHNEGDANCASWQRCNTLSISWIMRAISLDITKSIFSSLIMLLMFGMIQRINLLKQMCYGLLQLQEDISLINLGEKLVKSYYTELKILWEEYDKFQLLPPYRCGFGCDCTSYNTIKRQIEQDKVLGFLKGLGDQFSNVRSQNFLMEPANHQESFFTHHITREVTKFSSWIKRHC